MIQRRKNPRFRSSPLAFGDSELEEFGDDRGETKYKNRHINHDDDTEAQGDSLLEEKRLVSSVGLDPLLECLVLNERVVRSGWINIGETAKHGLDTECGTRHTGASSKFQSFYRQVASGHSTFSRPTSR